ncbi:hypothetical protein H5410_016761 [Solanum commersonii]|uniref:Uncharacterized protein n=1 Tax=Solanum commersonii TaxID=4109 RepID=A0A9J5ZXE5_SOLCO|nr:hypothetical protein H5410_016761 [Solanum commersonii]
MTVPRGRVVSLEARCLGRGASRRRCLVGRGLEAAALPCLERRVGVSRHDRASGRGRGLEARRCLRAM